MNIDDMILECKCLIEQKDKIKTSLVVDILIIVEDINDALDLAHYILERIGDGYWLSYNEEYGVSEIHNYANFNRGYIWVSCEDNYAKEFSNLPCRYEVAFYDDSKCRRPDYNSYSKTIKVFNDNYIYRKDRTNVLLEEFLDSYKIKENDS